MKNKVVNTVASIDNLTKDELDYIYRNLECSDFEVYESIHKKLQNARTTDKEQPKCNCGEMDICYPSTCPLNY